MKGLMRITVLTWCQAVLPLSAVLAAELAQPTLPAEATAPFAVANKQVQRLEMTVGKSRVLDSPVPIKRASLANPEVADTVILSPTQIYLNGRSVGVTNLTLWQDNEHIFSIIDVAVIPDLSRLKEDIHQNLPDEKEIKVASSHDRITLSGTVSSAAALPAVLEMAESYAPKKVVNMLQVGGVQQVMLEVRVAEMSRELLRRLGFNITYTSPNSFGITLLGNLTNLNTFTQTGPTLSEINQTVNQTITGVFGSGVGNLFWTAFIDALATQNLVKVLAKPTLVALHGQEAAFLAGGEFPIPVPQVFGIVTVQFKKFGVGLTFTPNVHSDKHIGITVAPEVSELDFSNALRIQGFIVPSITTRRASTVVELADGQSFAIGGLLRDNMRESISKFPFLGDVPILGALFRSSSFQKTETELVIIVTPHLVKPLDMTAQTLPTDYFVEANDFEFYFLGMAEKGGFGGSRGLMSPAAESVSRSRSRSYGRMEGVFGHIVP